jgi:hypothetical protein
VFEHGRSADTFVGVLPEDERAICRKQIYVVPSGGAQPFSHTPPELGFFSLLMPELLGQCFYSEGAVLSSR